MKLQLPPGRLVDPFPCSLLKPYASSDWLPRILSCAGEGRHRGQCLWQEQISLCIQCGFLVVLGLGPRALCLLGKRPTTRLHFSPICCWNALSLPGSAPAGWEVSHEESCEGCVYSGCSSRGFIASPFSSWTETTAAFSCIIHSSWRHTCQHH